VTVRTSRRDQPFEVRERLGDREPALDRRQLTAEQVEGEVEAASWLGGEERRRAVEPPVVVRSDLAGAGGGRVDRLAVSAVRDARRERLDRVQRVVVIAEWFLRNGVPPDVADELIESGHVFADFVRFAWNPTLVEAGDEIDGWRIHATPGHADGHLILHRDDVVIAGDTLLTPITPAIGLYPESRPDPLADYLSSLELVASLAPRISYGGHGVPVAEPAARCAAIAEHHAERLDRTEAALGGGPRSGYEVSHDLFGDSLSPIQRRFAVAEALSHLERLVAAGRAARSGDDRVVAYTR